MKRKLIGDDESGRRYAVVLDIEDDVLAQLQRFCEEEHVQAASLLGIGGFRRATLAYYDMERKRYDPIPIDEQVEVVSFAGNVTSYQGKVRLHVHCIVGRRDGRTSGGHLLEAVVRPTLEVMIDEAAATLYRVDRPDIGIPLIDL